MKRVLVFPCGTEIGLEIFRSLEYSKDFEVFGASTVDDHGKYVYKNYISYVPSVNDDSFIEKINKVVEDYNIDFLFPAHDSVVLKLAQNKSKIKTTIITAPVETCEICRSKRKTYELFRGIIRTPKVYNMADNLPFPVFLKPDVGQGSKGTLMANTLAEVEVALAKDKSLMITEYLPNTEYTGDCFTDRKGKLLFAQARERCRVSNGISMNSKIVNIPAISEVANKINETIKLRGVWFFQLKYSADNELCLLEIGPRTAGTMALCRVQGVILPLLSLYDFMGLDVSISMNAFDVEIDRALYARYKTNIVYENVYIDFDDTLILKNRVNSTLMCFLYQSLNEGKNIYLVTKHEENIYDSLERYKIPINMFKEIVSFTKERNNYEFIKDKSIFIDDCYSGHIKIYDELKSPIFNTSMIECLMSG
jgi:hypothetical protein